MFLFNFSDGKEVYNRQKHQLSSHYPYLPISCYAKTARTVAPQPNSSFQTKDPIHCRLTPGLSINISL